MNYNEMKFMIVTGASGSGKDSTVDELLAEDKRFHKVNRITTRPKRKNENGSNSYYFAKNDEEFNEYEAIAVTTYNGWKYGTLINSFHPNKINLIICGYKEVPLTYNSLVAIGASRNNILIINLIAEDGIRMQRQINRDSSNMTELCRRFLSDEDDKKYLLTTPYVQHFYNGEYMDRRLTVISIIKLIDYISF